MTEDKPITSKQFKTLTMIGWIGFTVQSSALNLIINGNDDLYFLSIAIVSCISSMFLMKK